MSLTNWRLIYSSTLIFVTTITGFAFASVSERGSYQTSIAMDVPQFHAIAPQIGLSYDSNAGDGPAGVGWVLTGGSSISRSSGFGNGAPRYDDSSDQSDQLWIDGMELLPCASSPRSVSCRTGGTHATRVENFARITQDVPTNSWTLWKQDGTRFLYSPQLGGNTSSPISTLRWALTQVIDTHQNRVNYNYTCDASLGCYLQAVSYGDGAICECETDRPVGTPISGARIQFYWESRPDPLVVAQGGFLEEFKQRLRAIDVTEAGQRVRVYQLSYQQDPTNEVGYRLNKSWLASIQMFGSDAQLAADGTVTSGTPMPAYTFTAPAQVELPSPSLSYSVSDEENQFLPPLAANPTLPHLYANRQVRQLPPTYYVTPWGNEVTSQTGVATGDFDGDGRLDFVQWSLNGDCTKLTTLPVLAGSSPGKDEQDWTAKKDCLISAANNPDAAGTTTISPLLAATASFASDLDGDGRTDLIFLQYKKVDPYAPLDLRYKATFVSALSNGEGTFTLGRPYDLWESESRWELFNSRCGVGDVNGDRRTDIVCVVPTRNGALIAVQGISDGLGGIQLKTATVPGTRLPFLNRHSLAVADSNGDGLFDLVIVEQAWNSLLTTNLEMSIGLSLGDGTFVWSAQPTGLSGAALGAKTQLLSGDFNGDRRADFAFVIAYQDGSGGSFSTFSSTGGESLPYSFSRDFIVGEMPAVSIGDRNGDGLDDALFAFHHKAHNASVCGVTINHDHTSLIWALSNGKVSAPITSTSDCRGETTSPWFGDWLGAGNARSADVNGDGRADAFQYYTEHPTTNDFFFTLVDWPADLVRDWRLRPADVSGDGQTDWVYTAFKNPGLMVNTAITLPSNTRKIVSENIAPSGGPQPDDLTRVDAVSDPFLVDVGGGPDNLPDGRADLVFIDDAQRQIVTLLSKGDGTWTKVVAPYGVSMNSILRGHVTLGRGSIRNWRAIDVNGDGRADLVHTAFFQPSSTGPGALQVDTLLSSGDGTWRGDGRCPGCPIGNFYFDGVYDDSNVRDFMSADINGDGRMDLVKVQNTSGRPSTASNTIIWSLIALGEGNWEAHHRPYDQPYQATTKWWPMEVNGDGRTDLAYISFKPGEFLTISTMLSIGNGEWDAVQTIEPSPQGASHRGVLSSFRVSDLDGDGRDDFVSLTNSVDAIGGITVDVFTFWNRYPKFVTTTTVDIPFSSMNISGWSLTHLDADQQRELVRMRKDFSSNFDVISIPVPQTRITHLENGLGRIERIFYETSVGNHATMPMGMRASIVTDVRVQASGVNSTPSVTTYQYTRATFSRKRRQFLGFEIIQSLEQNRILTTHFELTDDCRARPDEIKLLDPKQGLQIIRASRHHFDPIGIAGTIICREKYVERHEWDRTNIPRVTQDELTYDFYGNVTRVFQTGDPADAYDDRAIESGFYPNTDDFITNLPAFRRVQGVDENGNWGLLAETLYEYDLSGDYRYTPGAVGELTRQRRWNDQTSAHANTSYEYYKNGNLRLATGPAIPSNPKGNSLTIEYDCELQRFPVKTCDSLFCTEAVWDKRLGVIRFVTDSNGHSTEFRYDTLGRAESTWRPDGSFEKWRLPTINEWNTAAQAVTHEVSDASPTDGVLWSTTYFDGLGRTLEIKREGNISQRIVEYDGTSSRVLKRTAPYFNQNPPVETGFDFDAAGRLRLIKHPDLSTRRVQYEVGVTKTTNERGARIDYSIDPFGRITSVRENQRDCVAENCPIVQSGVTVYRYDALDRLSKIIDAHLNETEIEWTSLSQPRRVCDPDRGCTTYGWNDDGTIASKADANGSTQYTYDSLGRQVKRVSVGSATPSTRTVQWTWDYEPGTNTVRGASLGRITQVDDSSADASLMSSYRYDKLGRFDLTIDCVDQRCAELAMAYDPAGRLKVLTYPDNNGQVSGTSAQMYHDYDDSGRLFSLPGIVKRFDHNAAGQTTFLEFANGIQEFRTFDPDRNWSRSVHVQNRGLPPSRGLLFYQGVEHNRVGNVREETLNARRRSRTDTFTHDDLGRLTDVVSTDPARNRDFAYDLIGNMTYHSQLNRIYYNDNAHVHAITDTATGEHFTYDAIGQLKSSNRLQLDWTVENRPRQIVDNVNGISNFAYDWNGRRVKTDTPAGMTVQPNPLVDIDSSGEITTWVVVEGRRIARRDSRNLYFLHADSLGSVRAVTDRTGALVDQDDYGTWGEETRIANQSGNTYRFAGSQSDEHTGLVYMGSRYYEPITGHFISADTAIPDAYNPQFLNRYSYVLNDPVTLVDPSGHAPSPDDEIWGRREYIDFEEEEPIYSDTSRAEGRAATGMSRGMDAAVSQQRVSGPVPPQPLTQGDETLIRLRQLTLMKEARNQLSQELRSAVSNPLMFMPMFTPGQGTSARAMPYQETAFDHYSALGLTNEMYWIMDDLEDWIGPFYRFSQRISQSEEQAMQMFRAERQATANRALYRVSTETLNQQLGLYWIWQTAPDATMSTPATWQDVTKILNQQGLYLPWQVPPDMPR